MFICFRDMNASCKTRDSGLVAILVMMHLLWPTHLEAQETVKQGSVVAWGHNGYGQLKVPEGLGRIVDISAGGGIHGSHTLVVLEDQTVRAWGGNRFGQIDVPEGLDGVVSVKVGSYHNMALREDGTVVAWGWNEWGQSDVPQGLKGVTKIAAGTYHSMALLENQTVVAWGGRNSDTYQVDYGQTRVPEDLTAVIDIAGGRNHSAALRSDGTVVVWGDGRLGELDIPLGLEDVVAIGTGRSHTLALKRNGTVVAWGDNRGGQTHIPFGLTDVVAIAAGPRQNLALQRDGTLVVWGWMESRVYVPQEAHGPILFSAGADHSAVVLAEPSAESVAVSRLSILGMETVGGQDRIRLQVWGSGGALLSPASLTQYELLTSTDLGREASWSLVPFQKGASDGELLLETVATNPKRFFQLRPRVP